MSEQPQSTNEASEGKIPAVLSYFGVLGLLIAYLMTQNKKNSFVAYHMRQGIGFLILSIALYIVAFILAIAVPKIGFIAMLAYLGILVFWVLGIINAVGGHKKPLPLVGEKFQEWFKNVGA